MPVVLTLAAVATVAVLMAIGWRQRWDPEPQHMPPITLRSARTALSAPLPRWYWLSALAGFPILLLSSWLSWTLDRSWIATIGYVLFGASWAARQTATIWTTADTQLRRLAAIVRPLTLICGVAVAAGTKSLWPGVVAATLYLAILPAADALERRRDRRGSAEHPPEPPRSG